MMKEESLASYFSSIHGKDYASLEDRVLYKYIDDLVERRNDLAHGGNNIPMLGDDEFKDYLKFVKLYANALCSVLRQELAKSQWRVSERTELAPTNVYRNDIVCFQTKDETFKVDGYLIFKTAENPSKYDIQGFFPSKLKTSIIQPLNVMSKHQ